MTLVRRFRDFPSIERLTEIEAINILDLAPPAPPIGVGSGTVIVFGEFEDGPFATGRLANAEFWDGETKGEGIEEVFSGDDIAQRFGGFGFTYGGLQHNNPAARRHLSELWNGNGFIKLRFVGALRFLLARVDTSVGSVAFSSLACIEGGIGPFNMEPGQTLDITSDLGAGSSTAIAAVVATAAGTAGSFPTGFAGGEQIGITIDSNPEILVTFSAADQTLAQVIDRINGSLGFTAASDNAGELDLVGITRGTSGQVVLRDVTPGTLSVLGHSAGTTAGTGNVGNVDAVTATEIATIVNASAALTSNGISARIAASGNLRFCSATPSDGTLLISSGIMATVLEIDPVDVTVNAGTHNAGTIPAGTRVRNAGGDEWVTLQTLTIPEGTDTVPVGGPYSVKVRPALDDGSGVAAAAGTVDVAVDQPAFGEVSVTNPADIVVALTEPQMDTAYADAIDNSIGEKGSVREANYTLSARQSDAVRSKLRLNAIEASDCGHFGRKAILSAPLGFSKTQALAQVEQVRSDRVFYTWPGFRVRIPEIARRGEAGGLGFTESGIIDVRADGPLLSISAQRPPEENPGQETRLIEVFFDLEDTGTRMDKDCYIAAKRSGITAPRIARETGSIFQSGITTSLDPALVTQARRKMADFLQDSFANLLARFSKKLNTRSQRTAARGVIEQFLSGLKSEINPELQRIVDFSLSEASNTPDLEARGIWILIARVRTLASLDAIVLQTEIGEGVDVTVS